MSSGGLAPLTPAEIAKAAALDSDFFARTFFPKTMRQRSPEGHKRVWAALEDPNSRLVNLRMSRDFSKTSLARVYTAKRIAYALSHTIMYVGASEPHAARSIMWLQNRIATKDAGTGKLVQTPFAKFFNLHPGKKWNETELEIWNLNDQRPIYVLGMGITGNVRGVNFDDYRPDLIYCDDILTDDNAATKEQREKIQDLVLGAIKQSLAPRSEEPNAKMVLAQTPHHIGDISDIASKDSDWNTVDMPCWTLDTLHKPVDEQISAWEERHPTAALRAEKKKAIATRKYSLFAREKECRLVTAEDSAFNVTWLRVRKERPKPMYCVLAIDPVPPPSERQLERDLKDKDFEVQMVVGRLNGEYHVLDYVMNQGHQPNWSATTALSLALQWRVSQIVIESIAYQRSLKYIIEQEMKRRGIFFVINEAEGSSVNKYKRITNVISGPASQGRLWIGENMSELELQFQTYPKVDHDDVLDALSMGMQKLVNPYLEQETPTLDDMDAQMGDFELQLNAP